MNAIAYGVGRVLRALTVLAFGLGMVGLAAGLALAWRLSQGPLDVAWAARWAEAYVNAPDAPTRLSIGRAAVRWGGYAGGPGRGLELLVDDAVLTDQAGRRVAAVGTLETSVSMTRALLGQVAARDIAIRGLELNLVRDVAGEVTLDLGGTDLGEADAGPSSSVSDTVAELARPPRRDGIPRSPGPVHLEQLRRVRLADSVLLLHDKAIGVAARLNVAALALERQAGGGVRGTAAATVELGAARAQLSAQAELAADGGTQVQAIMAPVAAAAVQEAAPGLGLGLPGLLDAAVQATARVQLSSSLQPTGGVLHVEAGSGQMRVAGAPIGFDSLLLDVEAKWDRAGWTRPSSLLVPRAKAVLHAPGGGWPATFTGSGRVVLSGDHLDGAGEVTVDHLAFADLPGLWPERLGGHTRPWLTENITGGTVRDGALKAGFSAAPDFTGFKLTSIDGRLTGEDVTIHWFRPAPPVEHALAMLTIKNVEYLDIAVPSARQGGIALKDGTIHIIGLNVKDQFLTLGVNAAGPVSELITLLRQPSLHLLDRKPIPMRSPSGVMTGHLGVDLPVNHDLRFDQVKIDAKAHMKELHLGGLVGGRDLDHGEVQVEATEEALRAGGAAMVGGVPSDMQVDMDFRDGPPNQVVERAELQSRATARQLAGAGLDTGGLMTSGVGAFTARYAQRRDTTAELAVSADLRAAGLAVAGWRKAPGAGAEASATLMLRGERLLGIKAVQAQGPGIAVDGRVQMVGDRPLLLVLDRIVLGPTQARGELRFPATPGEPIRATLSGPQLDLSTQLGSKPAPSSGASPADAEASSPWIADIRFERVLLAKERGIGGVTAHAEFDGKRIAALQITTAGPERVEATIRREGAGRRVLVRAADGGAVLRAFDLVDTVRGGRLSMDAVYDDRRATSPLSGSVEMTGFQVDKAAALGKLLQAITIYGLVDALNGQGVAFSRLTLPFQWDGTLLDVGDARAFSASLGVTAKGRVDTGRHTIDLQGTVVPAYALNSALGRIPVLGRLFSAERGGGLFAVNYSMRGPAADPSVVVNPLSALTPGFLRGLFHILD